MSYPDYTRSERIADGAMHVLGVTGALVGAVFVVLLGAAHAGGGLTAALIVYAVTLVATFCASACYHMTPWENLRPGLRRLDHAAIYLKIAGTYTPLVVMVGSVLSYSVLAIVWALALLGMRKNLFVWSEPGKGGPMVPLIMGWLSLFLIWGLLPVIPPAGFWLIVTGGVVYSIGVIFHLAEKMRFSNAIWHLFVVVASACFFVAILMGAGLI